MLDMAKSIYSLPGPGRGVILLGVAAALLLAASSPRAMAEDAQPPVVTLDRMVVAGTLETVREEIVPSIGASTYTFGLDQVGSIPQGDNAPFNQVLIRAPGVVLDSFGEDHVRGEHGNLQYRINGILLPESLNGFGQEIDSRLIDSVTLTTGSLPAQFGFRTAGIIDVTTKTGSQLAGGQVGLYGGSYDTFQPSFQYGGSSGRSDYYVSLSDKYSDLGIENPTLELRPLHDFSEQLRAFSYVSDQIDAATRVSLLVNASAARFEIPDTPGLTPKYVLLGSLAPDSAGLDERQNEQNEYVVLAYQKSLGDLNFQVAGFSRYGRIHFLPDVPGDLAFSGVASDVTETALATGLQADASRRMGESHTVRAGVLLTAEQTQRDTTNKVFPADAGGAQLSELPVTILDDSRLHGVLAGFYLQDEWHPIDRLTVNYGLRYDLFDASFLREAQLSPRLNVVWKAGDQTSVHAGYSRYFTPPSLQYVSPASIARFAGTTNAPETTADSPPLPEQANYFDLGISRELSPDWRITVDAFYKTARNQQDLGQFGNAVILAPFNYREGLIHGAELGAIYRDRGWSAYANFSFVYTQARDINSAQYEFPTDELAYIATHDIRLDHEGEFSVSSGVSYRWRATKLSADFIYGNGLRAGFANLEKLPPYHPVGLSIERAVHPDLRWLSAIILRLDVVNVLDEKYILRNGTGVGIAAAQYGPRRGVFGGVSFPF